MRFGVVAGSQAAALGLSARRPCASRLTWTGARPLQAKCTPPGGSSSADVSRIHAASASDGSQERVMLETFMALW